MSVAMDVSLFFDGCAMKENERLRREELHLADEARLVAWAQAGRMEAFEELVRRFRNEVYALAYHFLRNREEAWDTSQEVFIKAYRSLKQFRGEASFKSWLLRITANHCKDQFKKRRLNAVAVEDEILMNSQSPDPHPGKQLESKELGAAINLAINQLPAKHRTAFMLREFQGLSYEEMAQVMQCSLGTVMSRLHHARKKLQNTLKERGVLEELQ
ncbi:MAG: sigma-70 family RNA polymerase sigma factor [Candidatus Hydrogenedentes bacterium]|nr:sigma-70 family RNA polymerase sigma factor [Candidatus Hydrogenedentota bacterium]